MIDLNIVVEDRLDAKLLRKYLPKIEGLTPRYYASAGKVSLATMARNLLVHEEGSVLVVMDTDSLNPQMAQQERLLTLATLRLVADVTRFDAFAFCPEHEVIFFETPDILERYWPGAEALSKASLERVGYAPKRELAKLLEAANLTAEQWFASLTAEDGEILRRSGQASHLVGLFEKLAAESHELALS